MNGDNSLLSPARKQVREASPDWRHKQKMLLVANVQDDPRSVESWYALLNAEEEEPQQSDGPNETLLRLYAQATRVLPCDVNVDNELYLRIWIGYAKQQMKVSIEDALETFKFLESRNIGDHFALRYTEWAKVELRAGYRTKALQVLKKGLTLRAMPVSELHRQFLDIYAADKAKSDVGTGGRGGLANSPSETGPRDRKPQKQEAVVSSPVTHNHNHSSCSSSSSDTAESFGTQEMVNSLSSTITKEETNGNSGTSLNNPRRFSKRVKPLGPPLRVALGDKAQSGGMEGADEQGAGLEGAHLQGAGPEGANMQGAGLEGAKLRGAGPEGAHLQGAGPEGANMQGAGLEGAKLRRAGPEGAHLQGAEPAGVNLPGAGPERANMHGAGLGGGNLQGAGLEGAHLQRAGLGGANPQGAGLEGPNMLRTGQEGANLQGAGPEGAKLMGAGPEGCKLVGGGPEGPKLSGAGLEGANLQGTGPGPARQPLKDRNMNRSEVKAGAINQPRKQHENESLVVVNNRRYQKLGKIGSGGSCDVFKVIDADCRIYALKRVHLRGKDHVSASSFYQEIDYLERLRGKRHIIQMVDHEVTNKNVLDRGGSAGEGKIEEDSTIYMVLEYGEIDLAGMLAAKRKATVDHTQILDENWLRLYWQHVLEAVETIHKERIVHSDLKPENFLLVKGELKLIDFGIAKAIQNDTTNILRENAMGTVSYMSPEALMHNCVDESGEVIKVGRASDIWSLGCILYQMVYGQTPFSHLNFLGKMKEITNPNHRINFPAISNYWLMDAMKKCLCWDPHKRLRIPELLVHPFLRPDLAPKPAIPRGPSGGEMQPQDVQQLILDVQRVCVADVSEFKNLVLRLLYSRLNGHGS